MTLTKIEPATIMMNFLRGRLVDVNAARSALGTAWVYDDWPRLTDLGANSFPRINITKIDESSQYLGISDDNQYESIILQIDVWAKKDHSHSYTLTDEALGTMGSTVNSNRLTFNTVPNTVTNIKHNAVAFGTITRKATDSLFTAPASLAAGNVEYSAATGNLNFSSADVASYDGQAITSTYIIVLEGEKLVRWMSRQVIKSIRSYWRSDSNFTGLFYPIKISAIIMPYDEETRLYRATVEYECRALNVGEGL